MRTASYIAPIVNLFLFVLCDSVFIFLNLKTFSNTAAAMFFIGVYNLLVIMAIWSLFMALSVDAGSIPLSYNYDET